MTTLHLGVIDVAYGWAAPPGETTVQAGLRVKRRKKKRTKARSLFGLTSAITTGDVATILEDKYHLMESFYQVHEKDIGNLIVQAVAGRLENIQLGVPTGSDAFGTATNQIEDMCKKFLSTREVEHLGIPPLSGERTVARAQQNAMSSLYTDETGKVHESWCYYPKADEVRFEGKSAIFLTGPGGEPHFIYHFE